MKKPLIITISLVIGLLTGACYNDTFPDESQIPLPENVSYAQEIQPIWNQSCVSCHQGNQDPDLRASVSFNILTTEGWVIPGNADGSILFRSLIGDGVSLMPPGNPLTTAKINLVKQWINEGALNN